MTNVKKFLAKSVEIFPYCKKVRGTSRFFPFAFEVLLKIRRIGFSRKFESCVKTAINLSRDGDGYLATVIMLPCDLKRVIEGLLGFGIFTMGTAKAFGCPLALVGLQAVECICGVIGSVEEVLKSSITVSSLSNLVALEREDIC